MVPAARLLRARFTPRPPAGAARGHLRPTTDQYGRPQAVYDGPLGPVSITEETCALWVAANLAYLDEVDTAARDAIAALSRVGPRVRRRINLAVGRLRRVHPSFRASGASFRRAVKAGAATVSAASIAYEPTRRALHDAQAEHRQQYPSHAFYQPPPKPPYRPAPEPPRRNTSSSTWPSVRGAGSYI
jgi:hypothetical protein